MAIDKKHKFCKNPFERLEIHENGEAFVCCPAWVSGSIGNIEEQSIKHVWNGAKAQEFRESIIDGSFRFCNLDKCGKFYSNESTVFDVSKFKDRDLKEIYEKRITELKYSPKIVSLSYDKTCNLSCPTCRTTLISSNKDDTSTQLNEIKSNILPFLKDTLLLKVTGSGDPFASKHFLELLAQLNPALAPNLKIYLQSNGLLLNEKTWERISHLKDRIEMLEISIDAAKATTYAVNRRGGDFDKLLCSLDFVRSIRNAGFIKEFSISFVVQSNNWREMSNFIALGKRFNADRVQFSAISNWGTFSETEFLHRAVHLSSHPDHQEFIDYINGPEFSEKIVALTNLSRLVNAKTSLTH